MINALKYIFASVFGKGANIIIVFLLAHGLTTEAFGQYYYILNVVGILMLIGQLGLPILVVREVAKGGDRPLERKGFLYFALTMNAISIAVIIAFLAVAGGTISLDGQTAPFVAIVVCLYSFAAITGSALAGLNRVYQGAWPDTLLRALIMIVGIGGLIIFAPDKLDLRGLLVLLALSHAASLFALVWQIWPFRRELFPAGSAQIKQWSWLKSTIVLGGASIATLLNTRVDILMLERMTPIEALATYAFSLQFVIFFTFPYVVVTSFLLPRISEYIERDRPRAKADYTLGATAIITITALVAAGMIAIALLGWDLIVPPAFAGSKLIIIVFALFYLVNTLVGPVAIYLNADNAETSVSLVSIISGIVNVVLNLMLIPALNELGAALATMLSMMVMNLVLYAVVVRRFGAISIVSRASFKQLARRTAERLGRQS